MNADNKAYSKEKSWFILHEERQWKCRGVQHTGDLGFTSTSILISGGVLTVCCIKLSPIAVSTDIFCSNTGPDSAGYCSASPLISFSILSIDSFSYFKFKYCFDQFFHFLVKTRCNRCKGMGWAVVSFAVLKN
jgi:hypothetical protein